MSLGFQLISCRRMHGDDWFPKLRTDSRWPRFYPQDISSHFNPVQLGWSRSLKRSSDGLGPTDVRSAKIKRVAAHCRGQIPKKLFAFAASGRFGTQFATTWIVVSNVPN
jgi:hypothetical protein